MALLKNYNFENLKNVSEQHVFDELERQLEAYPLPVCLCNDCVADMAAAALNHVPPMYRYSILGSIYSEDAINDEAYAKKLREAVLGSIERVRKNPSHDSPTAGLQGGGQS
jgi:competence protein ComFB